MDYTAVNTDGAWLAYAFFVCVGVITLGLLWFRVVRPMLEDFGVLQPVDDDSPAVNHSTQLAEHYVGDKPVLAELVPTEVQAFERAELGLFVPPVQLPNEINLVQLDIVRIDTLARLIASGVVSESTAITVVWDGRGGVVKVSKGGSKAYADRRDALRALAAHYGWQPPTPEPTAEPPRQIPVNNGKLGHVEL